MNEGYETVNAPSRSLVDKADAAGAQVLQGLIDVGDGKADVVCSFASPCEETGGSALVIGGGQELKSTGAGVEEGDFDAVGGGVEPLQKAEAEDAAVGCKGIVEALDDDADVVDVGVG